MTPLRWLNLLKRLFVVLLIWNVVLTINFCSYKSTMEQEKLNNQICNLEMIPETAPTFELIEE